jgi:hypothetical protein
MKRTHFTVSAFAYGLRRMVNGDTALVNKTCFEDKEE